MEKGRDKQPKATGDTVKIRRPGGPTASDKAKAPDSPGPGNIAADSRGRNVWHFHGEAIDSTSMMLQRLDNPELALEPTRKTKRLDESETQPSGRGLAGKAPVGKTPAAKGSAAKGAAGATRGSAKPGRRDDRESEESFKQSFSIKPGKNSGGGFDPYNRS